VKSTATVKFSCNPPYTYIYDIFQLELYLLLKIKRTFFYGIKEINKTLKEEPSAIF